MPWSWWNWAIYFRNMVVKLFFIVLRWPSLLLVLCIEQSPIVCHLTIWWAKQTTNSLGEASCSSLGQYKNLRVFSSIESLAYVMVTSVTVCSRCNILYGPRKANSLPASSWGLARDNVKADWYVGHSLTRHGNRDRFPFFLEDSQVLLVLLAWKFSEFNMGRAKKIKTLLEGRSHKWVGRDNRKIANFLPLDPGNFLYAS